MDLEAATTRGATTSRPTTPEEPGYVNPLESSSRWYLSARANVIRHAASLAQSISNRTDPPAPAPTREVWFDSTLSKDHKGPDAIKVEVWIPPKPAGRGNVVNTNKDAGNSSGDGHGHLGLALGPNGSAVSRNNSTSHLSVANSHLSATPSNNLSATNSNSNNLSVTNSSTNINDLSATSSNNYLSASASNTLSESVSNATSNAGDGGGPGTPNGNGVGVNAQTNGNGTGGGVGGAKRRCAVINCHGGGWILGQGTDDSRFAGVLMTTLDAVVFTVNYRLAPTYPFPTAVEDCVDVACQVARRAGEFGIDPDRIVLSGFSAGATNSLTSWIVMQDPDHFGYTLPCGSDSRPPTILGLCLFYPGLDWTMSRPTKRQTCSRPDLTLPRGLTDLIDACYLYPPRAREDCTDLRLSPGLMGDDLLARLPPVHLCLCEYDMLLAEGLRFSNRLSLAGKKVRCRVVEGEKHAWDNPPPMSLKPSAWAEYAAAAQSMAEWFGTTHEADHDSSKSLKTKRTILKRPSYMSFRSARSSMR